MADSIEVVSVKSAVAVFVAAMLAGIVVALYRNVRTRVKGQ